MNIKLKQVIKGLGIGLSLLATSVNAAQLPPGVSQSNIDPYRPANAVPAGKVWVERLPTIVNDPLVVTVKNITKDGFDLSSNDPKPRSQ